MEPPLHPLNFYCRSARLCMKKAAFSKKAQLFADELLHLKKFDTLVSSTIPSHPHFEDKKTEKQVVEIQSYLLEMRKRIQQLDSGAAASKPLFTMKHVNGRAKVRKGHSRPLTLPAFSNETHISIHKPLKKAKVMPKKHRSIVKQPTWELWPPSNHEHDQASSRSASPSKQGFGVNLAGFTMSSTNKSLCRMSSNDGKENGSDSMGRRSECELLASSGEQFHSNVEQTFTASASRNLNHGKIDHNPHSSLDGDFISAENHCSGSPNKFLGAVQSRTLNGKQDAANFDTNSDQRGKSLVSVAANLSVNADELDEAQKMKDGCPFQDKEQGGHHEDKTCLLPCVARLQKVNTCAVPKDSFMSFTKSLWNDRKVGNASNSHPDLQKAESMHKEWVCSKMVAVKPGESLSGSLNGHSQNYSLDESRHEGEKKRNDKRTEYLDPAESDLPGQKLINADRIPLTDGKAQEKLLNESDQYINHVASSHCLPDYISAELRSGLRSVKDKAGLALGIRTKLEEEYERLKEQMKFLKSRDGFARRDSMGMGQGMAQEECCTHKVRIENQALGQTNEIKLLKVSTQQEAGEELRKFVSHTAEADTEGFEATKAKQASQLHQKSNHLANGDAESKHYDGRDSKGSDIQDGDKKHAYANTDTKSVHHQDLFNSSQLAFTSSPPSPSSYHASLPFSHYITKLKQLVPDNVSKDTGWPLECDLSKTMSSSPPYGVMRSPACDKGEYAHSLSSSDTFADSLTYSNPVFDFECETELPECSSRNIQLESGLSKEETMPEDDQLESFLGGSTYFASHLAAAGNKDTCAGYQVNDRTEMVSTYQSATGLTPEHQHSPLFEYHGRHHGPIHTENGHLDAQTEDISDSQKEFFIAGHKFRFAKEFYKKRQQEKLDKIEQGKVFQMADKGLTTPTESSVTTLEGNLRGKFNKDQRDDDDFLKPSPAVLENFECEEKQLSKAEVCTDKVQLVLPDWLVKSQCGNDGALKRSLESTSRIANIVTHCQTERAHTDRLHSVCTRNGPKAGGKEAGVNLCSNSEVNEITEHTVERIRLEERIQQLERELQHQRDQTEQEMGLMRGYIENHVCNKVHELMGTLQETQCHFKVKEQEKENLMYQMNAKVEHCENKVKFFKQQVDCLLEELKTSLIKKVHENRSVGLHNLNCEMKGQMEVLAKNVETLSYELNSSIAMVKKEVGEKCKNQAVAFESLIEQKLDRFTAQQIVPVFKERENIARLRSDLHLVWEEIHLLCKGREDMRDEVSKLAQVAGEAKECLQKEQGSLKLENGLLKKQVQHLSMKTRASYTEIKRDVETVMENVQIALKKVKEDGEHLKRDAEILKRLEEGLINDKADLTRLLEHARDEERARNSEIEMLRELREEFLREKKEHFPDGNQDDGLLLEKIDSLSQFYLSGLEEVREDLLSLKSMWQIRLTELEYHFEEFVTKHRQNALTSGNSLQELVMDGLETRVSHLEHKLEGKQQADAEQKEVNNIMTILEQERNQAAIAAADAVTCAQRAEGVLAEISGAFSTEIESARIHSQRLQDSICLEREAMAVAFAEVHRMNNDLVQEKGLALAAFSEAKRKGFQIWEGLEKDISYLESSIHSIEKDKEVAAIAAMEATEAATKAQEMLQELYEARKQASHKEAQEQNRVQPDASCSDELHSEKTSAAGAPEVCSVAEDHNNATMISDIHVSPPTTNPFQEDQFDHRIKKTEDLISHLAKTVTDMSESLDSQLRYKVRRMEDQETRDHQLIEMRARVEDLGQSVSKMSQSNCCLEGEQKKQENLLHDLSKQMSTVSTEQHNIISKMHEMSKKAQNLEGTLANVVQSVEAVQTSRVDFEKSSTKVLTEFEMRIHHLENATQRDTHPESLHPHHRDQQTELSENQQLLSLYREMSAFIQKLQKVEGEERQESTLQNTKTCTDLAGFESRVVGLESRVKQVEFSTTHNTRILDEKAEYLNSGIQTALEAATLAESKCTALGAELVKVFRMLASSQKDNVPKLMDTEDNKEQQPQFQKGEIVPGGKGKLPPPHAACASCKRTSPKGTDDHAKDYSVSDSKSKLSKDHNTNAKTPEEILYIEGPKVTQGDRKDTETQSPMIHSGTQERAIHMDPAAQAHVSSTFSSRMLIHGNEAAPVVKMGRKFSLTASKRGSLDTDDKGAILGVVKQHNSEMMILEGKLPITQGRLGKRRIGSTKQESVHISSARDYQTNFRLNSGGIYVNVSHRSAVISGARLVKKGDTFTVKPQVD